MEILSNYPQAVQDRAARASGIAAYVAYPNLAKMKEHLDHWRDEYLTEQDRIARASRKKLPEPPRDLEAEARVKQGMEELVKHLKSGFGPSTAS